MRDTFPAQYNNWASDLSFHSAYIDQKLRALVKAADRPQRPGDRIAFRNPGGAQEIFRIENAIYVGGGKYFAPGTPDANAPKDGYIHTAARLIQLLEALRTPGNNEPVTKSPELAYVIFPE